jgi:uncharacterized protein (TIGR02284 family)
MNMDKNIIVDLLNELIEICKDGQEGFQEAAENSKSSELKRFFSEESAIRGRMMSDLQSEVLRLGSEPDWQGSVGGAVGRAWLELIEFVGAGDKFILSSVESEEDKAVQTYERILREPLPSDLYTLINQQYVSIKAVHDHIRALRDKEEYSRKTA